MFEKLPSNSKQLLDDILQADNPSEFLHKYYVYYIWRKHYNHLY